MKFDEHFFVALAFVIFISVIVAIARKAFVQGLDNRATRIKDELGEALRLKEEAQALLASYQHKQKEVVEEAENIVKEAHKEADRIIKQSEKDLEEALNKRVEMAMQKIASYEAAIVQQVKDNAIDVAIATVRSVVAENLNKDMADRLIGRAIADIQKKLH